MSNPIIIHSTPRYLQVAFMEEDKVSEIDMAPVDSQLGVGDILYGKIARVISALRIAFVEIGRSRTALLHFSDVCLPAGKGYTNPAQYLRAGQLVLVQMSKLPRGEKGAVVTMNIQLVGATVIYQPMGKGISVAKSIVDEQERQRLWAILNNTPHLGGGMVRSYAVSQSSEVIMKEWGLLIEKWQQLAEQAKKMKKPAVIHSEQSLACTFIRGHLSPKLGDIIVDNNEIYKEVYNYLSERLPFLLPQLKKANQRTSPWKKYRIDKYIDELLHSKVILPSGGFILIERTETMIVIDVNTGQFVKAKSGVDIIYQTNIEAAVAIAHYIRVCNLSGTIVIDFIRMRGDEQQEHVKAVLEETLSQDTAYCKTYGFSPLGLVEMTRQRKGNSWIELYNA